MSRRAISCSASPDGDGGLHRDRLAVGDRLAGLVHRQAPQHGPADVAVGQKADKLAVGRAEREPAGPRPVHARQSIGDGRVRVRW